MPPQVFYSFNETASPPTVEIDNKNINLPQFFQMAGIHDTIKMVSLPLSLNTLVVRLENIADLYDNDAPTVYLTEFKELLEKMWQSANSDSNALADIDIQEMTLTANMRLREGSCGEPSMTSRNSTSRVKTPQRLTARSSCIHRESEPSWSPSNIKKTLRSKLCNDLTIKSEYQFFWSLGFWG